MSVRSVAITIGPIDRTVSAGVTETTGKTQMNVRHAGADHALGIGLAAPGILQALLGKDTGLGAPDATMTMKIGGRVEGATQGTGSGTDHLLPIPETDAGIVAKGATGRGITDQAGERAP